MQKPAYTKTIKLKKKKKYQMQSTDILFLKLEFF